MKNLEQIRARNALNALRTPGPGPGMDKTDVAGLPALVQSCGLLATAAYVGTGQEARRGMLSAMNAVARHLRDPEIAILRQSAGTREESEAERLVRELAGRDSTALIAATTEALAYLSYLKRFVR